MSQKPNQNESGLLELARGQEFSPKFGAKKQIVQLDFTEYKRLVDKGAAFRAWQFKLKPGDRLPRGKFFKGKVGGKPVFIFDEFWSYASRPD